MTCNEWPVECDLCFRPAGTSMVSTGMTKIPCMASLLEKPIHLVVNTDLDFCPRAALLH